MPPLPRKRPFNLHTKTNEWTAWKQQRVPVSYVFIRRLIRSRQVSMEAGQAQYAPHAEETNDGHQ